MEVCSYFIGHLIELLENSKIRDIVGIKIFFNARQTHGQPELKNILISTLQYEK